MKEKLHGNNKRDYLWGLQTMRSSVFLLILSISWYLEVTDRFSSTSIRKHLHKKNMLLPVDKTHGVSLKRRAVAFYVICMFREKSL